MKNFLGLSVVAAMAATSVSAMSNAQLAAKINDLENELTTVKKQLKKQDKKINKVKAHDAFDNIKFGVDFRSAVDVLDYKNNKTGETAENHSLLTSRLYLTMKSSPVSGLTFNGKLAVYSIWGAELYHSEDGPFKSWAASSKASDTVLRVKEAYFVYSTEVGEQPISFSIGRRPSTNGYLANYRENEPTSGSPAAHITNMEVDAGMVKFDWDRFIPGAYTKFVYGRAHAGDIQGVYGTKGIDPKGPYAETDSDDVEVDFFVMPGMAYNDGQYEVMYQWAHIFNTKGINNTTGEKKVGAGTADLLSLSFKADGIGDGISDFLDETTFFISGAYTNYNADSGYSLLGSEDGGSKDGSSIWAGVIFPDMMTDDGKIGFEYNHGTKYWTPMTWAEDTALGSKVAVRGDAYEVYWNFNLFGLKNLPSQIRYTYIQHDYTPNINCAGWVAPKEVDLTEKDLRFSISYRY
jgi:hypothetical protein